MANEEIFEFVIKKLVVWTASLIEGFLRKNSILQCHHEQAHSLYGIIMNIFLHGPRLIREIRFRFSKHCILKAMGCSCLTTVKTITPSLLMPYLLQI